MKKPFRVALSLWITPDFDEVLTGKRAPPRVNHSAVDFEALARLLKETFTYGPPVNIRVPNDTIDQVTMHERMSSPHGSDAHCEDFGRELIRCAGAQKGVVIDVRQSWQALHVLSDRDFAPPPVLIPFVIEAADFDDAMIWHASAKPCLGLPFPLPGIPTVHDIEQREDGQLPAVAQRRLADIFGSPFLPMALLDRMAMDKPPMEYGRST